MAFTVIQNTKLTQPFTFTSLQPVTYPVSPLVSAKFYTRRWRLNPKIRATLYMNSEDTVAQQYKHNRIW